MNTVLTEPGHIVYVEGVSSIRNLRMRHAVVTRDPPDTGNTMIAVLKAMNDRFIRTAHRGY
jgi:hypothetical protein